MLSCPPKIPPKKPTKRIRISTACVNCRHKKIKCDGQVPCAHCEKFRTECIYPVATKPANQEYVETLENRLKSVESHLHGLLSRGWGKGAPGGPMGMDGQEHGELVPDDGDAVSPYTPSSIPATPPSKSSHTNTSSTHEMRHSHNIPLTRHFSEASISTPHLTGHESDVEDTNFAADDSMQVLGLLMGNLKVERDGVAQYIPRILDQKERSYSDSRVYSSSPSNGFPDFSALDWESSELPLPYTLPNTLLTPKAIGALMDIYFNSVHTFLPVIHKTSFLTLCQEGEYRVPPFLLMAICAVAVRHATDFELQEIPELSNLKSHHALYDHARSLLDTFMDVPRLSTVQGLLLLAYYQTKEKRSGHFFRIRMYVNMATRMALDMGLQRAMFKNLGEIESSNTGDSLSSVGSPFARPLNAVSNTTSQYSAMLMNVRQQNGGSHMRDHGAQQTRLSHEKRVVIHQENRLAWLGCFFLDGLTSSMMGQEYCVTNATLDMPKLIQEASLMADTVQGATLIFWYHHLELIQIYRRICLFYRAIPNERVLSRAVKSADMQAIESSLGGWLTNLPAHLVYVDSNSSSNNNNGNHSTTGACSTPLPSYYTLYLHRFFYSHKLLLYRPLITSKTHRGDLKDSNSPIAKCSQAATMLTQIGEIIFQNYSWPWPGCGLFAYHMLQAAEIHVFQMVMQSPVDSQSLYYRTMDLIKGYVSLAKLPDLEKDIVAMEDMVNNFLLTPQNQHQQQHSHQHQNQHQHFVATPASDYSYASVMSPASPAESVQRMSMSHSGGQNGNMMHTHQHQHQHQHQHHQNTEDADMFSPLPTNTYPSFESASRVFRQPQGSTAQVGSNMTAATASGFMTNTGFSMGFDLPGMSSASTAGPQPQSSANSAVYNASQSLPFYNPVATSAGNTNTASSSGAFNSNNTHSSSHALPAYGQPSFLHSASATLAPVGDLLGLGGGMDSRPSFGGSNTASSLTGTQQQQSSSMSTAQAVDAARKKATVPPPKPPKRILSQSTGSSSSSVISQSLKPPVPKKPTRLTEIPAPRWIAPRPETSTATTNSTSMAIPAAVGFISASAAAAGSSGHPGGLPSGPSAGAGTGGSGDRAIKVLQPQATLYGMGNLVNSLGIEQQIHPMPEEPDHSSSSSNRGYYDGHEAFHYLQMNPHLYDQLPPHNRRQLI
ncbi:hypothetical protein EDD11_001845 [Mortierella claussenii]|nr:hypothetical protein EDD11_001845 [Mortierella claussenii]